MGNGAITKMGINYYTAGFLTIFTAAFIQGVTGFGFALIAVPLLSMLLLPQTVVPVVVIYSLFTNIIMIWQTRTRLNLNNTGVLVVFGIIGIPLGISALRFMPAQPLKLLAGIIIVLTSLALIKGFTITTRSQKFASALAGLVSGFLNGSTSMSGPPIVLFLANQKVEKEVFRANLPAYSLVTNIITIGGFLVSGLITGDVLKFSGFFSIAMLLGVVIGIGVARKINEAAFRRIVLGLILLLGLSTVITAVKAVFF